MPLCLLNQRAIYFGSLELGNFLVAAHIDSVLEESPYPK